MPPDALEACTRLRSALASAGERYPSIPYLGFALWLAWQRLMWGIGLASASPASSTAFLGLPPSLAMHLVVNGALVVWVFGHTALASRFGQPSGQHPIGWGALASAVGSAGSAISVALELPWWIFVASCLVAGFGMGALLMRALELFGSVAPSRLLLLTGMSWCAAAAVNLIVGTFGPIVASTVFCLLPFATAACFAAAPEPSPLAPAPAAAEPPSQRVPLPRSFWAFAFTVFAVSLAAQSVIYFNGEHYSAVDRHAASVAVDGVMLLVTLGLMAYAILRPRSHNYGALYYPVVFGVMGLLTLLFVAPAHTVAPLVISRVVFQVFGLILWCLLHYVAAQSGSPAIKVYGFGYGLHMLGSIMGYGVGYLLNGTHPWADANALFWYLGAAILVLAICVAVYPPRTMHDLLASIPFDDAQPQNPSKPDAWLAACDAVAAAGNLTDREREVMLFLARGRGSAHIAQSLTVSLSTTYTHTRNIYRKLDVHSREELMALVDTYLPPAAPQA